MKTKNTYYLILIILIGLSLFSCKKDESSDEDNIAGITLENIHPEYMNFINENEGWIYGQDHNGKNILLHSTDGFQHHNIVNNDMQDIINMKFIDNNVGFADTYYDNNLYTFDGGASWHGFQNPPAENYGWMSYNSTYFMVPLFDYDANTGHQYVGVMFYNRSDASYSHIVEYKNIDALTYHGSTGGDIHQTSVHVGNNGKTCLMGEYQDDANFQSHIYSVFATNVNDAQQTEMPGNHAPERLDFPSDNVGYYTQKDDEHLYKTSNSGQTWTSVYSFSNQANDYKQLSFSTEDKGAVLVGDQLFFTTDGGQSFEKYNLNAPANTYAGIIAVDYVTTNAAYVLMGMQNNTGDLTVKLLKINK